MKILFLARHFSYLRNFESAIALMAQRGHTIHLAVDREESLGGRQMIEKLAAKYPSITVGLTPARERTPWAELGRSLRLGVDYLRYLDPRYASASRLVRRSRDRTPGTIVWLSELPVLRGATGRRMMARSFRWLETAIPWSHDFDAYLNEQSPDIVLLTPLIDLGSPQVEYHASAKALGLRTVLCVTSWDHLSSKSLLRLMPDLVTVWNDMQRQEAVEFHGVPPDRVAVTGAQCYDQWFGWKPSCSREAFCQKVGLRPDRPFLLYVCSSLFRGTANEAAFVEEWVQRIRSSEDPRLREAGLLIRPHPARLDEWQQTDLTDFKNVAFFGEHPVTESAKADYFDSMYHSAAVVGLNTSAFLEAGVVGRPVHTILLPGISRDNQEGTIHFHYLLNVNGGLLHAARSFEEHLSELAETLARPTAFDEKSRRFTEAFIRPQGLDSASTPRFVEAIERAGGEPRPAALRAGPSSAIGRALLYPAVGIVHLKMNTQWFRKELRYNVRRAVRNFRKQFWMRLKHAAAARLKPQGALKNPDVPQPSALTPKLGRHRDPAKRLLGSQFAEARETKELVTLLGRSEDPLVVGPWLTETGFELLYWIPFLAWAKAYGSLRDENLFVISRGGAAPWYRHLAANYGDVFQLYSPDEFRARNDQRMLEQRGKMKPNAISTFDREIIERLTREWGLGKYNVLHPSAMYNLFQMFWHQLAPVTLIESFTTFRTLPAVSTQDVRRHLPEQYVAAKFYANTALPDTAENRAFITSFLEELTRTTDVVLLNTGHRFDDHEDFPPAVRARLHTVDHLMTPASNLEIQTKIITGARAFVGTYGGFSYLAPLCGVDTLAFYSHPTGFRFDHLEVAKRVFSSLKCGSFVPLDVRDLNVVRLGFGRAGVQHGIVELGRR